MHRILKEALPDAEGHAEHVVAIIADIRGFSAFSTRHESSDTAMYIKRVYTRLIDDYFPFATFFKPTGDGLLITVRFNDEKTLLQSARDSVNACLRCLGEFSDICKGDPMINFEVPSGIGFGLTRGIACCLSSGDTVLDYSGHILNLASRLTDLARPSGIVIDGSFGVELLEPEERRKFKAEHVYIKSVAEEEPREVYVLKRVVKVSEQARLPLRLEHWEDLSKEATVREWRDLGPRFIINLPHRLKRPDGIRLTVHYPAYRSGKKVPNVRSEHYFQEFDYELIANQPRVVVSVGDMVDYVRKRRATLSDAIVLKISYVRQI